MINILMSDVLLKSRKTIVLTFRLMKTINNLKPKEKLVLNLFDQPLLLILTATRQRGNRSTKYQHSLTVGLFMDRHRI